MGKVAARQKGVVFGRKPGSNERKADFLKKESSKKILKHLKEGKNSIRRIATLTDSSTVTVMKVKRVAMETNALKRSNY